MVDVPYTANNLPDEDEMDSFLISKLGNSISINSQTLKMNHVFPDSYSFFKSIKKIGTGTSLNGYSLSPAQLRRLLAYWNASCYYGVEVQHNICFFKVVRQF